MRVLLIIMLLLDLSLYGQETPQSRDISIIKFNSDTRRSSLLEDYQEFINQSGISDESSIYLDSIDFISSKLNQDNGFHSFGVGSYAIQSYFDSNIQQYEEYIINNITDDYTEINISNSPIIAFNWDADNKDNINVNVIINWSTLYDTLSFNEKNSIDIDLEIKFKHQISTSNSLSKSIYYTTKAFYDYLNGDRTFHLTDWIQSDTLVSASSKSSTKFKYYLSPAGLPIGLPKNTALSFYKGPHWTCDSVTKYYTFGTALVGFTLTEPFSAEGCTNPPGKYIAVSKKRCSNYFKGYKNIASNSFFIQCKGRVSAGSDILVNLGEFNKNTGGNCHEEYILKTIEWRVLVNDNDSCAGSITEDPAASGVGAPHNGSVSDPIVIPLCLPEIPAEVFQNDAQFVAWFKPGEPQAHSGVMMKYGSGDNTQYWFAYNEAGEPEYSYFVWHPKDGWRIASEPEWPPYIDVGTFLKAVGQIVADYGHTSLDLLGFVPVFGTVADGINTIWYIAEGNTVEAAFSAAAVIPIIGDLSAGAKISLKLKNAAADAAPMIDDMAAIGSVTAKKAGKAIDGTPSSFVKTLEESGLRDKLHEVFADDKVTWVRRLNKDLEANPRILDKLLENPNTVEAWHKMFNSADSGIKALRKDVSSLHKFDEIVQNNNLGLDADGLRAILDAAAIKGQKWDSPDKILDAVKRASDGNIPGITVKHKKFPTPSEGSDPFVLKNAKQYQKEASGDSGLSFEAGGRSFDNVDPDGKLIDRKYGHGSSVFNSDGTIKNQTRADKIIQQANEQVMAANGQPIRWEVSTELGTDGIQELFTNQGINIEVVHVAQQNIIS